MSKPRCNLFCMLVLLLQTRSPCGANVAYLQPESIYLGDIVELVIEYKNTIPSLYPLDTKALAADFEILNRKSRVLRLTETEQVIYRMQWRLQLTPRRSGSIVVPELRFGNKSTPRLTLEVAPVPPALQSNQDVFIEMEASTLVPYVGQQTQIDMRLYHNTPLGEGHLLEPEAANALVHRQLAERVYGAIRKGQDYQVVERSIVLFPRSAGELKLTPTNYRGTIDAAAAATLPEATSGSRKITRRSNPLSLQVREPPPEFSGRFWLPANRIEISQTWEQAGNELETGESLDWTLAIVAHGLPAESLPQDLLARDTGDLRIYADQPIRSNRFEGGQIIGRLEQRFAVIASKSGEINLPDVSLKWWDVDSDSEQQARLEAITIKVVDPAKPAAMQTLQQRKLIDSLWPVSSHDRQQMLWLSLLLLLLAAIFTAFRWQQIHIVGMVKRLLRHRRLMRCLKLCCLSNDAQGTRRALLEWGMGRWHGQKIIGLHQIGDRVASRELSAQLIQLDAALYSQYPFDWRGGQVLWTMIHRADRDARNISKPPRKELPKLYPI